MTAPRLSAYQAFIIAAGELFSVLTAAAASPPPPERFMAAVSDAVATIDRAHSSLLLVASQDALTAAAEVVQRAHRIREFLDPYQRSPHGLGELTQEYASACNAFTRTARDEVGNERSLSGRRSSAYVRRSDDDQGTAPAVVISEAGTGSALTHVRDIRPKFPQDYGDPF